MVPNSIIDNACGNLKVKSKRGKLFQVPSDQAEDLDEEVMEIDKDDAVNGDVGKYC